MTAASGKDAREVIAVLSEEEHADEIIDLLGA